MKQSGKKRNLVAVLDLDQTLVHTDPACDTRKSDKIDLTRMYELSQERQASIPPSLRYRFHCHNSKGERSSLIWGTIRPGTRDFLIWLQANFDYIVVWSAAQREYVHSVVRHLWNGLRPPAMILTYNELNTFSGVYTKPLRVVSSLMNISIENILLFDDNPDVSVDNPDNVVMMPPFTHLDLEDSCLGKLTMLLENRFLPWCQSKNISQLGLRQLLIEG